MILDEHGISLYARMIGTQNTFESWLMPYSKPKWRIVRYNSVPKKAFSSLSQTRFQLSEENNLGERTMNLTVIVSKRAAMHAIVLEELIVRHPKPSDPKTTSDFVYRTC